MDAKRASAGGERTSYFSGRNGRLRLIDAVRLQSLVSGDSDIARELVGCSSCHHFQQNDVIMTQGEPDNDIVLIISGEASIRVNGRHVASRQAGTHVGEMALIDPMATRSATVVATEPCVVIRVPEQQFSKIAKRHPELWRRIAIEIAKRLRERNKLIRTPHNEPVLFVGSSSEGLPIANELNRQLLNKRVVVRLWTKGVFLASSTAIESLVKQAQDVDFAALVITSDDVVVSRGKKKASPRDNVIFELGLFMGALGRERVFILKPKGVDIRIPSDLLGVVWLDYLRRGPQSLRARVRKTSKRVLDDIKRIGPK